MNEEDLKVAIDAKLIRARATGVPSAAMIKEITNHSWDEDLDHVEVLLIASNKENLALTQELIKLK